MKFDKEQKFLLRFEFQASELGSLDWGIMQEDDSIKRNDVIWNKINEVMSDQFGSSGKKSERFPWWNRINKKNLVMSTEAGVQVQYLGCQ